MIETWLIDLSLGNPSQYYLIALEEFQLKLVLTVHSVQVLLILVPTITTETVPHTCQQGGDTTTLLANFPLA